ncbi:MAG: signal peptidase I [Bacteroidetes bacterium]|nr:signal peptidase I [Bacteroidota bacterium]
MPTHQLLVLIIIQLLIVTFPAAGMYKMFQKANIPGWKALIPFYNTWIIFSLTKRPRYLFFLQFIPIAGWFISMSIFVEFAKTFGKFKLYEHTMAALLPVLYFIYLGFDKKEKYLGTAVVRSHKKSTVREWIDAGVFAVVAATLIRAFVFEAYAIPTGSMEKTLLVKDYLFVSKFSYGMRVPNTPLALPFIHNSIPFTNSKSYVEWIKIPYTRWFEQPVKRNDVVVFNMPEGDTVINKEEYGTKILYYDVIRKLGNGNPDVGRKIVADDPDDYPLAVHPVDKEDNYIKRCVAVGGDTLQIKDQVVYVNGVAASLPPESEYFYYVETNGQPLDETVMKEEYNVDINNNEQFLTTEKKNIYYMLLTADAKQKLIKNGVAKTVTPEMITDASAEKIFPYDNFHHWTIDEFGPMWIPAKGATLTLTAENYPIYERIIRTYEGNKLERNGNTFFINGQQTNQYTFKMNYYWMMGDNRHDSQDSRVWGFVPGDHIVGKAAFIFMSLGDGGVRWSRLLKGIH